MAPQLHELPAPPEGCTGWPWTEGTPPSAPALPNGAPWPKISIVTPSYNQGVYIEETIRSILLQGYANLEYIVMDGGSTDDSADIIRKYAPWLFHWVSEKDRGQTHAINKGFAVSSGAICCYINSDDILYPGTLQKVAQVFSALASPALVCGSGRLFGPAADRLLGTTAAQGRVEHAWTPPAAPLLTDWITTHASLLQQSAFWDRQVHDALGGFSESLNFCFDKEFFLRAIFELHAYHAAPEILAGGHRLHDATKTATIPDVMIRENEDIRRRYTALPWCQRQMAREARERRAQDLMASALAEGGFANRVRSLATSASLSPRVLRDRMFWGAVKRTLTLQRTRS